MSIQVALALLFSLFSITEGSDGRQIDEVQERQPYVIVLGIAQDGGVPQAGTKEHEGWRNDDFKRYVVCLAVIDPATSQRWLIDCTPDFPEQLHRLDVLVPVEERPGLDGIFLTHAHMGHYTGLMHLGHESMGAREVAVHAMPRMFEFLTANGPWDQLVRYKNITLNPLRDGTPVRLNPRLTITPFSVPHRQEYSEVVGYRITGPSRSVVFIPDIDTWEEWDDLGTRIETVVSDADVAYLDGTFYSNDDIPGRDISGFPHPFITNTMKRLAVLEPEGRGKVRFLHLNHTNPVLHPGSDARATIEKNGFRAAEESERVDL